jgi:UDP-4-amino-4,6-dideoxy-N-acetyl-beta-L-altrosamine transaminase
MKSNKKVYPYGKQRITWRDTWAVLKTMYSPYLTQGPKITQFEKDLSDYTGAKYALAVANGTLALNLAVAALELEAGFEGITSTNTFVASANCFEAAGGRAVFADIDPQTANVTAASLETKISPKTRVLIPVHFAGQSCDMKAIHALAKKHNLFVIEDAAHAIGSLYAGKKVGSCEFSDMSIFSFHPVKNMTTGEGGAITTNDAKLYERLQILRTIGITRNPALMKRNDGPWFYEMQYLSPNCRMSDIQAALGISQLKQLNGFVAKRRALVEQYREEFRGDDRFTLLKEEAFSQAAFHLCPLLINFEKLKINKVDLFLKLRELGVITQVHYIPVHTQPYYQGRGSKLGDCPVAESYYQKTLSLPLYVDLRASDVRAIAKIIKAAVL